MMTAGAVFASSNCENLFFDRCIFNNESYNSTSDGSCIYTEATTTVIQVLDYDNSCNNSSDGGHVYIDDGTASIVNCTLQKMVLEVV